MYTGLLTGTVLPSEQKPLQSLLPELIVNGTVAKPGSWPWTISMHIHSKRDPDFQTCGGSLISPYWVRHGLSLSETDKKRHCRS